MLVRRKGLKAKIPYAIIILLCAGIIIFSFAADQSKAMAKQDEQKEMKHKEGMHEEMMEHGMMKPMCPMHMMMAEHMMKTEVMKTSDDGLIILAHGKIYKYDKDLNLVKEVECKAAADMKVKMEEMHKECMEKCQGMMKDKGKHNPK
jgi:hypothetical protein